MEGTIVSFKRGRHTQTTNQMIIIVDKVDNRKKAAEFVGKNITWKSPSGKEIKGLVRSAHGNKGAIRVLFETGMPGQSLMNKVSIS